MTTARDLRAVIARYLDFVRHDQSRRPVNDPLPVHQFTQSLDVTGEAAVAMQVEQVYRTLSVSTLQLLQNAFIADWHALPTHARAKRFCIDRVELINRLLAERERG